MLVAGSGIYRYGSMVYMLLSALTRGSHVQACSGLHRLGTLVGSVLPSADANT